MKELISRIKANKTYLIAIITVSFFYGMLDGANNGYCEYDSISSKTNVFYIAGCEYAKPRYRTNLSRARNLIKGTYKGQQEVLGEVATSIKEFREQILKEANE